MIQNKDLIEDSTVLELINRLENAHRLKDDFLFSILLTRLNLLGYTLEINEEALQ